MLSERVAQKPTMPVKAGKKNVKNWPLFGCPGAKSDGWDNMGPKPPAWRYAQSNSNNPRAIKSGALMLSNHRMQSIPLYTTHMLMAQKNRKQISCGKVIPNAVG